jgi:hypothetical protein
MYSEAVEELNTDFAVKRAVVFSRHRDVSAADCVFAISLMEREYNHRKDDCKERKK